MSYENTYPPDPRRRRASGFSAEAGLSGTDLFLNRIQKGMVFNMKKLLAILLASVTALSLTACGGNGGSSSGGTGNTTPDGQPVEATGQLVAGRVTDITGGNLFTTAWGNGAADKDVRDLINGYETTVYTKKGLYDVNPTAVEKMDTVDNGDGSKTFIFTLQKDLKFSDGSDITAKDYVFSVLLQNSPVFGTVDGADTNKNPELVGFDEFNAGETNAFAGVRLLGDYQFSLTVKSERLPFFYENYLVQVIPYPMAILAPSATITDSENGAVIENLTADELAKTIGDPTTGYRYNPSVSAGPYKFVSFDRSSKQAVVEVNPYFKGNYEGQKPSIAKIVLKSVTTANQRDELASGSVDLLTNVSGGTEIEAGLALVDEGKADYTSYDRAGYGRIAFACDFGPTQFVKVRQAIAHLIDGPEFAKQFTGGYGKVVKGMYGVGQWMYQQTADEIERTLDDYEYDVQKAIALLEEDGWTKNAQGGAYQSGTRYKEVDGKLMPLEINWANTTPNPVTDLLNTVLPSAFEQAGIKLNATTMEFNVLLQNLQRQGITEPQYHIYNLATGFEPVFDPWYAYNMDDKYMGVFNQNFIKDEELFKLATDLRETDQSDTETYAKKWVAFQQRWNEILPDIPLYSDVYHDFYSTKLRGYGNVDSFWSWTQQILYCWIGRE